MKDNICGFSHQIPTANIFHHHQEWLSNCTAAKKGNNIGMSTHFLHRCYFTEELLKFISCRFFCEWEKQKENHYWSGIMVSFFALAFNPIIWFRLLQIKVTRESIKVSFQSRIFAITLVWMERILMKYRVPKRNKSWSYFKTFIIKFFDCKHFLRHN